MKSTRFTSATVRIEIQVFRQAHTTMAGINQ